MTRSGRGPGNQSLKATRNAQDPRSAWSPRVLEAFGCRGRKGRTPRHGAAVGNFTESKQQTRDRGTGRQSARPHNGRETPRQRPSRVGMDPDSTRERDERAGRGGVHDDTHGPPQSREGPTWKPGPETRPTPAVACGTWRTSLL